MALTQVQSGMLEGGLNLSPSAPANTLVTTSAGNVGIGTSSPTTFSGFKTLELANSSGNAISLVAGTSVIAQTISSNSNSLVYMGARSNHSLVLTTNDTERMRIDTSGRLLVNTTSIPTVNNASVGIVQSYTSDSNSTAVGDQRTALVLRGEGGASNNSGAYSCLVLSINQGLANNPGVMLRGYGGNGGTTYSLQVNGNGNITNSNNSYGSLSDFKLKENIVDATPKLEDVMRLQVRNFNFKKSLGYEDNKQIGFVAQEFEQVFPGLVESVSKNDSGEDDANIKSIKTSVLVPILVKAIQEQQAIITDLKARIETLEAK